MNYDKEFEKWTETDNIFIPKDTTKEDSIKIINNHKQAFIAGASWQREQLEAERIKGRCPQCQHLEKCEWKANEGTGYCSEFEAKLDLLEGIK